MNRRNFIKSGAFWVPTIFIPRLIRAQDSHANFLKKTAQQQKAASGGACATSRDSNSGTVFANESCGQSAGNTYMSMWFTASASYTLCSLTLNMTKVASPTFNVTAVLFADGGSGPTGSAITTSGNVASSTVGSATTFTGMSASIVSGTKYWIAIHAISSSNDGVNYVQFNGKVGGAGDHAFQSSDGSSWSSQDTFVLPLFTSFSN